MFQPTKNGFIKACPDPKHMKISPVAVFHAATIAGTIIAVGLLASMAPTAEAGHNTLDNCETAAEAHYEKATTEALQSERSKHQAIGDVYLTLSQETDSTCSWFDPNTI